MRTCDGNCLEKLRAALTEHHGADSQVYLDLKTTVNMRTGQMGAALPPLYYSFKVGKKCKKAHVKFPFCSLCGKVAR